MEQPTQLPVGRRVAELRKLRGLTQAGLAAKLHRSQSWVTKIERGERRVDSIAVLRELSEALGVSLDQLTWQDGNAVEDGERQRVTDLQALCRVLDRPAIAGIGDGCRLRPVAEVQREAMELTRLYNSARRNFTAVLPRLPVLIHEAQSAALTVPEAERRRANAALAALYRLAALEFGLWGPELVRGRVAMDRALSAAEAAGDPLLFGGIAAMHTVQLMNQGDAANAVAVAIEIADLVANDPRADTPTGMVVAGQLNQYAAKAAARAGDSSETRSLLRVASKRAERLGRDRGAYGLYFGLANAAMQEVCSLVDLGDPHEAVRKAEGIRVEWLGSVNRIGFYCIHQARAHSMRGQDDRALDAIVTGLRMAPELVRLEPTATTLVRNMLHRRRYVCEQLRKVAHALRITD